jgi:hypothetical protein
LWELGFETQARLFDYVCDFMGSAPPVIDGSDVLRNPPGMLRLLCERLGVPFSERMLSWPAGPRQSDGVWAKYWYDAVHRSTGFAPYQARKMNLSADLRRLADACRPYYEKLHAHRCVA